MGRKGRACGPAGFTLIEVMIVFAIIAIMALILIGIINPTALIGKGKDARRKKDLARIKVAFEEYYNDKGCYPKIGTGIDTNPKEYDLNNPISCGSPVFAPWLVPWPCDPDGEPYEVKVPAGDCPNYYRAYTILDITNDKDIPDGLGTLIWPYDSSSIQTNYGVSSPNVTWYDEAPGMCLVSIRLGGPCDGSCQTSNDGGNDNWNAVGTCSGANCYMARDKLCKINYCPGNVVCR